MADETTKKKVLKLAGALGRSIAKAKGQTVDETKALKVHVEFDVYFTPDGRHFQVIGEGWRDGQREDEENLEISETFPDQIDLGEPWHDLTLYALTRWALYRHYVETQDWRDVTASAIRQRIAALTESDLEAFAMQVHEAHRVEPDSVTQVRGFLVALLTPEAPNG